MALNTDELIEILAHQAQPVRRLRPPAVRTAAWLVPAGVYLASMTLMVARGGAIAAVVSDPLRAAEQIAAAALGIAAAFAAFATVIPGARRRVLLLPAMAGAAWAGVTIAASVRDLRQWGTFALAKQSDWPCVVSMLVSAGLLLLLIMLPMLRRGAALTPLSTGVLAGVAAAGLGNVGAYLARPHPFSSIVLVWHGGMILLIAAALAAIARYLLPWRRATLS